MGGSLRIGEFADLLGVTTKTVRHYHRVGLLPEPIRNPNGYRQYGLEAVLRALQVLRLRQLGLHSETSSPCSRNSPARGGLARCSGRSSPISKSKSLSFRRDEREFWNWSNSRTSRTNGILMR